MTLNPNEIRRQLIADVKEAWIVDTVLEGTPLLKPEPPYAYVRLATVPMEFDGVRTMRHEFNFEIGGRFEREVSTSAEEEKVLKANALLTLLTANPQYAGGYLPTPASVQFFESDDPSEPVYELVVSFTVSRNEGYFG